MDLMIGIDMNYRVESTTDTQDTRRLHDEIYWLMPFSWFEYDLTLA